LLRATLAMESMLAGVISAFFCLNSREVVLGKTPRIASRTPVKNPTDVRIFLLAALGHFPPLLCMTR